MIKETKKPIASGTSFHGHTVHATLTELVAVLGQPHGIGEYGDKVQNEWELEYEGNVFTVYDWKEYRNYSGTEQIEWHIGAFDSSSAYRACEALQEALAKGININEQTKTKNMSSKPNLFQSVKAFINSKKVGDTFTTKEFHIAMTGIEQLTWWKRSNGNEFYRSNTYRTYLRHLGFVSNLERGLWRVLCHIPAWLDSGHVNSALGYMTEAVRKSNGDLEIISMPYKGMSKEDILWKIATYKVEYGVPTITKETVASAPVEAPKEETDYLAEYQKQSGILAKELAMNIIGDGKSPNVWFVSNSAYFMKYKDGYGESFMLQGYDSTFSVMYGPFFTYKDACAKYDEIDLDAYDGVGTVTIEDRKIGVVKEKFLEEIITVDYNYNEIDDSARVRDSKFYNNK